MTTRARILAPEHLRALNTIEFEFHGKNAHDRHVVEAWRSYLAHLSATGLPPEVFDQKRQELFVDLLHALTEALGFSFEKSSLRNPSYYPVALGDLENDNYQIRKATLALLNGQIALPVYADPEVRSPPLPAATAISPADQGGKAARTR
jgi:hypothetical protein